AAGGLRGGGGGRREGGGRRPLGVDRQAARRTAPGGAVIFAAPSWSGDQMSGNWDVLRYYTLDHLRITFLALALGILVAFPLGLLGYRWRRIYAPILSVSNVLYSIPSLALLVLLGTVFGRILSDRPLIVTLAIY